MALFSKNPWKAPRCRCVALCPTLVLEHRRQEAGSTVAPAGGTPPSCPASDSLSGSETQRPHLDVPIHDAQAPVTLLLVALARIPPEPWAGGAFSSLGLKALSWGTLGAPPNSEQIEAQGDGPLPRGQQQDQRPGSPAAEKEVEA